MKINWKIRFKNKVWLGAFIGAFVVFGFTLCRLFGVETPLDEYDVMRTVEAILTALALVGIIQDPTTSGIGDSDLAMTYGREEESEDVQHQDLQQEG